MAFRRSLTSAKSASNFIKNYSSGGKFVDVSVDGTTGFATVTMQRAPVNGLNLDLLTDLLSAFTELENNKARGMILTSSMKTIFSGGLDVFEMYKPDGDRLKQFWTTLQDTWLKLYGSPYPTVALVNGHSPAGGCLLAMSCEYRVMVNNFSIGLNETQLGIIAPTWFISTMRNTINKRDAELALTSGRLFSTDEALKVGLIDAIVPNKDTGVAEATTFLHKFDKIPPVARALTKKSLRGEDIEALVRGRDKDLDSFVAYITQPKVQQGLEVYMQSLKKK